jgi:hypothetical protein
VIKIKRESYQFAEIFIDNSKFSDKCKLYTALQLKTIKALKASNNTEQTIGEQLRKNVH